MPKIQYKKPYQKETKYNKHVLYGNIDILDRIAQNSVLTIVEMEQDIELGRKEFNLLLMICEKTQKCGLSPIEKKVCYLYFWKKQKYKKINQILEINHSGNALYRARKKIKMALEVHNKKKNNIL